MQVRKGRGHVSSLMGAFYWAVGWPPGAIRAIGGLRSPLLWAAGQEGPPQSYAELCVNILLGLIFP